MSLRLTRGEYWLLRRSVEHQFALPTLALPEGPPWDRTTIQLFFNCEGHGMPFDELARTLCALVARGWIAIERYDDQPVPGDLASIRAELLGHNGFELEQMAYYGLTALGGEMWERFARPEWDRYIEHENKYPESLEDLDIAAHAEDVNDWRCAYVITMQQRTLNGYMQAVRFEYEVAADSERFDEVEDWQPVYWKPEMRALRCRFSYRKKPFCPVMGDWPDNHRDINYYRNAWCEWR
ncbi:hypothetical protein [Lysobacter capsici]|uniref:hypothetical protein n=1 Tax=Lysobacter capsici TaxID=435897 RepID=UPI001C004AE3|nr:hypothetical protein [Lysobacter capsici]QWF18661.1 hypothetical protein KME82_07920 [Lysobacter capsici]